jgi:hypothetical protein
MIGKATQRTGLRRRRVATRKLGCVIERYTLHKLFYGNWDAKFSKKPYLSWKNVCFYTVVSITLSLGPAIAHHFQYVS